MGKSGSLGLIRESLSLRTYLLPEWTHLQCSFDDIFVTSTCTIFSVNGLNPDFYLPPWSAFPSYLGLCLNFYSQTLFLEAQNGFISVSVFTVEIFLIGDLHHELVRSCDFQLVRVASFVVVDLGGN